MESNLFPVTHGACHSISRQQIREPRAGAKLRVLEVREIQADRPCLLGESSKWAGFLLPPSRTGMGCLEFARNHTIPIKCTWQTGCQQEELR